MKIMRLKNTRASSRICAQFTARRVVLRGQRALLLWSDGGAI